MPQNQEDNGTYIQRKYDFQIFFLNKGTRVGFWTKTLKYPDLSLDRPEEAKENNTIFYGDKEFARLHASSNHYVI